MSAFRIVRNDNQEEIMRDRIDIDSDIPDNLIFYIYDSLIEGFYTLDKR